MNKLVVHLSYFCFLFFLGAIVNLGQTSPLWGDLKKGTFVAGYKVFEEKDYARATRPKTDFQGKTFEGERARRITFRVWYPATVDSSARPMLYEDYSFVSSSQAALTEAQKKQIREDIKASVGASISEEKRTSLLAMPTGAYHNAPPVNRKFPLIISASLSRTIAEYLASHGYVVAQISGGRSDFGFSDTTQDLEFALNELRKDPQVDLSKIGAMGFSFAGGIAALLQMKTNNVDAVISFDGVEAWTQARTSLAVFPYFRPEAATVPYLRFHDTERKAEDVDFAIFYDRAAFMNYTQIDYKDLGHRTADVAILNHLMPGFDGENPKNSLLHHRLLAEYTLHFFGEHLKNDAAAREYLKRSPEQNAFPKDFVTIKRKDPLPRPPSSTEAAEVIDRQGIEAFLKIDKDLKTKQSKPFTSQMLSSLIFQYVNRRDKMISRVLAELLIETYPDLATSYFNSALAFRDTGQVELAVKHFEKFLEVAKTDSTMPSATKESLRSRAIQGIENLKNGMQL